MTAMKQNENIAVQETIPSVSVATAFKVGDIVKLKDPSVEPRHSAGTYAVFHAARETRFEIIEVTPFGTYKARNLSNGQEYAGYRWRWELVEAKLHPAHPFAVGDKLRRTQSPLAPSRSFEGRKVGDIVTVIDLPNPSGGISVSIRYANGYETWEPKSNFVKVEACGLKVGDRVVYRKTPENRYPADCYGTVSKIEPFGGEVQRVYAEDWTHGRKVGFFWSNRLELATDEPKASDQILAMTSPTARVVFPMADLPPLAPVDLNSWVGKKVHRKGREWALPREVLAVIGDKLVISSLEKNRLLHLPVGEVVEFVPPKPLDTPAKDLWYVALVDKVTGTIKPSANPAGHREYKDAANEAKRLAKKHNARFAVIGCLDEYDPVGNVRPV